MNVPDVVVVHAHKKSFQSDKMARNQNKKRVPSEPSLENVAAEVFNESIGKWEDFLRQSTDGP